MKVRVIIIKILLCFSFSNFIVNAQINDEQLNAFRSAKRIKIVLRQSLDESIDYNDISFVDVTKRLLEEYDKCKVVGTNNNKFDLILGLDIEVKRKEIKTKSGRKITIRQAIELSGNISLEVPDQPVYKKSFYGREFGHKFEWAFTSTGSFLNEILEIIGEVWGTEAIVSCLKDKDIYVVMRTTDVLGKMKDPIAVQPLLNAFNETTDYNRNGKRYSKEYIQSFMLSALGEIGDERAVPYFMSYFKNCRGSELAAKAVEALGKSKALWTIKPLLYATECWGVGGTVKEELLQIGKPAVDTLISSLQKEKISTSQRDLIISVLSDIGDPKAVEPLITILNDNNVAYKSNVVGALGRLCDSMAVEPLINKFQKHRGFDEHSLNPAIYYALAKIGSRKAIDFLFSTYNNLSGFNQNDAMDDFKSITNPSGIAYIIYLLMDKKCHDRELAAESLGEINDTTSVKPLISVFSDEESPLAIRKAAYRSLIKKINRSRALKHILAVLENTEDNRMKMFLISELGRIKDTRAINPLMSIFNDKQSPENIRIESAKSLVKIDYNKKKDPVIVESLIIIALTTLKNKKYNHYKNIVSTFREWKSGADLELRKRVPKVTIEGQLIDRESRKPYKNGHLFFGELTENGGCIIYGDYTTKTDTNCFFILKNVPMLVGEHTVAISDKIVDVSFILKIIDQNAFNTSSSYGNYKAGRLKDGVISISHLGLDFSLTFSIQNFDLLKFEIPSGKQTELKLEF